MDRTRLLAIEKVKACGTPKWAGILPAAEKHEARKLLKNGDESPAPRARFVGQIFEISHAI